MFDVGLSSALRGQRRRQVQVRPDRHADEYGRHGDGRSECGSRQVVRDGPKQSARGLHTEWGTTMSVPMPSAKNCGLDASMRGFRPERHALASRTAELRFRRLDGASPFALPAQCGPAQHAVVRTAAGGQLSPARRIGQSVMEPFPRQSASSLASVPSRKYEEQFSRSVLWTEYAMRFPTTGATDSVLLISSVGRSAHLCHAFEGLDTSVAAAIPPPSPG